MSLYYCGSRLREADFPSTIEACPSVRADGSEHANSYRTDWKCTAFDGAAERDG